MKEQRNERLFYGNWFLGLHNKLTNKRKAPVTPAGNCLKNASEV